MQAARALLSSMPPPDSACIPFSLWMERALFAPGTGYYSARIRTVGGRGDFSTSATATPAFGQAVARWVRQELRRWPQVRAVIEVGGGDGSLSASVRQALGWWQRHRLSWHMVETSPVLREKQRERLGANTATWHETLSSALAATGGRALIFSNELVDAFPVVLLEWAEAMGGWQEVWVRRTDQGWREELRPWAADLEAGRVFSALHQWTSGSPPPHARQRVELHASFLNWLRGWAQGWTAGSMLTVDYGDELPSLYARRPSGTLRAYLLHHRLTGPEIYANMGRQDLTADVNFTDLRQWGEAMGWTGNQVITQSEFLKEHLPHFEHRLQRDPVLAHLADPHGAGQAFKVWTVAAPARK